MNNTLIPKRTKKAFRQYLNEQAEKHGYKHKNFRFGQRVRPYGDYLYAQDRDMFNENYGRWLKGEYDAPISK